MPLGYPATGARLKGNWGKAFLVFLLWVSFHVWLTLTVPEERVQESKTDILERIIAATVIAAQNEHRLPAWQEPWVVEQGEDWIDTIDFYCGAPLSRGEFPARALPDWALAHFLIGDKQRANELLALARDQLGAADRESQLVENYVAGKASDPELLFWAEDEWSRGTVGWPGLHILSEAAESEEDRIHLTLWLQTTGSKAVQQGALADMFGDVVGAVGIICLLLLLVFRRRVPAAMPRYRLPSGWDLSALVHLLFLTLFVSGIAAMLIWESLADAWLWTLGMVVASTCILVVPTVWFISRFTPGCDAAVRLFGLRGCRGVAVYPWRWSIVFGLAVAGGMLVLSDVLESVAPIDSWAEHPEDWLRFEILDTPFQRGFGLLMAVVAAPFCEEFLHRGFVFGALRTKIPAVYAAIFSSAAFATVHWYSWFGWLMVFLMGLLFCWLFHRSNSLWPGILAHAIYNFVVIFYVQAWFSL